MDKDRQSEYDGMELTHLDRDGRARMVNVGSKPVTERVAVARCRVNLEQKTLALIQSGTVAKGDVLTVAQIAGIQAAKQTHHLIPMCHPLLLTQIAVNLKPVKSEARAWIDVEATVRTLGKTGVEMEALTAASVAALTVYDMCKSVDRAMCITDLCLLHKSGGKSGTWTRE
jgi:cyclic pyranopterin phosphate synthase